MQIKRRKTLPPRPYGTEKSVPKGAAGEVQKTCPECHRQVKVGGPMDGQYTFQAHSPDPDNDPAKMCAGYGQKIKASP